MKYSIILMALLLSACTTVPVERKFPDVPEDLMKSCRPLEKAKPDAKFSDILGVVSHNYGKYHECNAQNEAWHNWYNQQKQIFEQVK